MVRGTLCRVLSMPKRAQRVPRRLLSLLTGAGRVTVLVFLLVTSGGVRADFAPLRADRFNVRPSRGEDTNETALHILEFTCEFYVGAGQARLDGLMAFDASQYRIAIYWIEPDLFRESTSFLRYSDFLFGPAVVQYWVYGLSAARTFPLSTTAPDPLLAPQNSVESGVRSALAILTRIRCQSEREEIPLEVGRFFRKSRTEAQYTYEASPGEPNSDNLRATGVSDVQTLNALPFGREYSKEMQSDGSLVWSARRALNGQPLVSVIIKPMMRSQDTDWRGAFDPNTLGKWVRVPEPYRAYWSFDSAYWQLSNSPDGRAGARDLHDKIESYLVDKVVPARIGRALDRLRFKTALLTDDIDRVCRSAQAAVKRLCADESLSKREGLLESARIAGQVERQYPQRAEGLLGPLAEQMVRHAALGAVDSLDELMQAIDANKCFTYGTLLLGEVRKQGLAKEETVSTMVLRLELTRIARNPEAADACESSASVKQYLQRLDSDPPRGTMKMEDVREILECVLTKYYNEPGAEAKDKVIEDTIRSIRLIVGDGPFCGDEGKLTKSVERFAGRYLLVEKVTEPIDTVLATFLALSFCDISTAEDHDMICSQFHSCAVALQSRVNAMLSQRGLNSLVNAEDVNGVFAQYERTFRRYVDDPLWPTFRFPWTRTEESRLAANLGLRFMQLDPVFDEMSLKVKHGGASAELRRKIVYEISRAAQQIVAESAHLRKVPYPGLSLRYRGRYGFTVVIRGPFYQEGDRPREKFMAMKYFHLGHRLEEVVKRERELTMPATRRSGSPETPPREQEAVDNEAGRSTDSERLR